MYYLESYLYKLDSHAESFKNAEHLKSKMFKCSQMFCQVPLEIVQAQISPMMITLLTDEGPLHSYGAVLEACEGSSLVKMHALKYTSSCLWIYRGSKRVE